MLNVEKDKQKSNFFLKNSNPNLPRNLPTINNKQSVPIKSSNTSLNVIKFIKDKNKFYIQNFFDECGAKKFLKSKEIALMEIKLNDEIICENNKHNNFNLIEKNLKLMNKSSNMNENNINIINKSANEYGNEYCIKINNKSLNLNINENSIKITNKSGNEEENENCIKIINKSANADGNNNKEDNNNFSPKVRRGKTLGHNKKRKKEKKIRKQKTEKKKFKNKNFNDFDSNNMIVRVNGNKSNSHDSHSSHHIYKFIIDYVNESEDIFNEKLEKEIKRFKTKRLNSRNNNNFNDFLKTSTNKKSANEDNSNNIKQCMTNKLTKKSIFDFSQNAKVLMESNDFDISSINDKTMQNKNESNFLKILDSTGKKEIIKKSNFADEKNNNNDNYEINSEHHSLISILSDLM